MTNNCILILQKKIPHPIYVHSLDWKEYTEMMTVAENHMSNCTRTRISGIMEKDTKSLFPPRLFSGKEVVSVCLCLDPVTPHFNTERETSEGIRWTMNK